MSCACQLLNKRIYDDDDEFTTVMAATGRIASTGQTFVTRQPLSHSISHRSVRFKGQCVWCWLTAVIGLLHHTQVPPQVPLSVREIWTPHLTRGSLGPRESAPNRHFDLFMRSDIRRRRWRCGLTDVCPCMEIVVALGDLQQLRVPVDSVPA